MSSVIKAVTKKEFDGFNPFRGGPAYVKPEEKEWYVDENNNILGIVFRDPADDDWGYIVQGRDEKGKFRGIKVDTSIETQAQAKERLLAAMKKVYDSGETVFPQED